MKRLALILALLITPALAQQQSPVEQALLAKISIEVNAGIQCSIGLITAQARIKELEDKLKAQEAKPPG